MPLRSQSNICLIKATAITIKNSEIIGTSEYKGLEGNEISIIDSKVDLSAKQYAIDCVGDVEIKNSTLNAFIPDNYAFAKLSAIRAGAILSLREARLQLQQARMKMTLAKPTELRRRVSHLTKLT